MISTAATPEEYFESLPADRQEVINRLYSTITSNLPNGFDQGMSYGMLTWVVPHSTYPNGYHCDPKQALPFLSLASQKNFIALYHMGIYADKALYDWFVAEYPKHSKTKLDMGKSCIRFKKPENIPFDLLAELFQKMTPSDWVMQYEKMLNAPRETK
ncbi:DUF1801 domain-containing protein [Flavobacterium sp. RNTU_13]|uniref:DUF1801 domain-containing protein n=1 Tax=Flavobacterium sp. RNTU_13 TaxID=3375145 RepID=UPI0039857169